MPPADDLADLRHRLHRREVRRRGKKTANARLTLKHNGVTVHDNVELKNATGGGQPETAKPGPIQLQNHGDPVVFRNIWAKAK